MFSSDTHVHEAWTDVAAKMNRLEVFPHNDHASVCLHNRCWPYHAPSGGTLCLGTPVKYRQCCRKDFGHVCRLVVIMLSGHNARCSQSVNKVILCLTDRVANCIFPLQHEYKTSHVCKVDGVSSRPSKQNHDEVRYRTFCYRLLCPLSECPGSSMATM